MILRIITLYIKLIGIVATIFCIQKTAIAKSLVEVDNIAGVIPPVTKFDRQQLNPIAQNTLTKVDEYNRLAKRKYEQGEASARGTRLEKHILNHSILVARDDLSSADRYSEAGVKKAEAGNYQGALADFNTAIKLNPRHAKSYNRRGGVKYVTYKDNKGSLADFNKAIELDPNLATAYSNRCALKMSGLTDYPGALADCNRAIGLDPKGKDAYNNRGLLRFNFLQDKAGGIADFEKIVSLLQKENKTKDANTLRGRIKKMKLEVNKVSDTRRSI